MADLGRQSYLMSTDKLEQVGSAVAFQKAMERGGKWLPHGCRLFPVAPGWESDMVMRTHGTRRADTLMMFEAAVRDADIKVIFVPKSARMTDEDLERICQRNGATKTIFREGDLT